MFPKFKIPVKDDPFNREDDSILARLLAWRSLFEREKADQGWHPDFGSIQLSDIPKCHLNCIFQQTLSQGCAYSDYQCICGLLSTVLLEEKFEMCTKGCDSNQDSLWAPAAILDFCESADKPVELPAFMQQYPPLRRRQFNSDGIFTMFSSVGDDPTIIAPDPTTFTYVTTLPYGEEAYTTYSSDGGEIVEIIGQANTDILTTDVVTSTLGTGAAPYTSTFTNANSPEATRVIGLPAIVSGDTTSNPKGAGPDSTTSPGSNPTTPVKSTGLGTGAKIGIGVAVPLVVLLLIGIGIFFFIRRRRQHKVPPAIHQVHEKDDGGLPENVTSIPELPKHPSYVGLAVGPNSVHELNADRLDSNNPTPAEIQGTPLQGTPRQELDESASSRHELTASPIMPPAAIVRKPISPAPERAVPVAAAPWEDRGYDAYETPAPLTEEDLEIQRMEEEMAQVKLRKERLQSLQLLEEREEALKKSIAEKRNKGGPSTS